MLVWQEGTNSSLFVYVRVCFHVSMHIGAQYQFKIGFTGNMILSQMFATNLAVVFATLGEPLGS